MILFLHYIRRYKLSILDFTQAKLNAFNLSVLKHLRKGDILAKRGFKVQSVPFACNKLNAPAAATHRVKEAVRFNDVCYFHPLLPFYRADGFKIFLGKVKIILA